MSALLTRLAANTIDLDPTTGQDNPTNIQANSDAIDQIFTGLVTASETASGVVELATTAECATGTATDVVGTPAGIQANFDAQVSAFGKTLVDDADAATARATLGLDSMATQAASAVAITGGSVSGITDLAVADGGTGASDAAGARTNLDLYSTGEVDALIGLPTLYIAGLTLSNNSTDSEHDIDIAAGTCRDTTDATAITLSAMTKAFDTTWAAGDGNGGMQSGSSLPTSSWIHVYAIGKTDGTADVQAVPHGTALSLPSGYTLYRRIGSLPTDASANIIKFYQNGQDFVVDEMVEDLVTSTPATTRTLLTVTVPPGMRGNFGLALEYSSGAYEVVFIDTRQTDVAPSGTTYTIKNSSSSTRQTIECHRWVDANGQVAYRAGAASGGTLRVRTIGWTDYMED